MDLDPLTLLFFNCHHLTSPQKVKKVIFPSGFWVKNMQENVTFSLGTIALIDAIVKKLLVKSWYS